MGIAISSRSPVVSLLLAPLQALAALFAPAPSALSSPIPTSESPLRRCVPSDVPPAMKNRVAGTRHTTATGPKPCQTVAKIASPRRLKIVREFEAGISPSCAGRLVISGRMADVCAELDRMAQREAAAQAA